MTDDDDGAAAAADDDDDDADDADGCDVDADEIWSHVIYPLFDVFPAQEVCSRGWRLGGTQNQGGLCLHTPTL